MRTRTKLAGNQPSPSATRPHHHSLLVASITSMTSPALKPSSWSSMVTWSQSASAQTTLPSLMSCGENQGGQVTGVRVFLPSVPHPWEGGILTRGTEGQTEAPSEPAALREAGLCPGHV